MASPQITPSPLASDPSSSDSEISRSLLPLLTILSSSLTSLVSTVNRIPGSPIVIRYIKSSYQNDPYRSLLEVLLVAFALRTLLKGRTRGEVAGKNFVQLTDKVCASARCYFSRDVLAWK